MKGIVLVLLIYLIIGRLRPCQTHSIYDNEAAELPSIPAQIQYGIRSQRDLMENITIDKIPLVGVNVYNTLLKNRTSNNKTLSRFMELMQCGVQSFSVDIEVRHHQWMLKESTISFASFLETFQSYVNGSDDNLSANMLVLLLRVSVNNSTGSAGNLTDILNNNLGRQRIYTPADLEFDRGGNDGHTLRNSGSIHNVGWPTLRSFIYDKRRRVILMELNSTRTESLIYQSSPYIFNDPSILHLDHNNASSGIPSNVDRIEKLSNISWKFLESSFTTSDIKQYMDIGYNPIISNEYNDRTFTNIFELLNVTILWSWKPNEPRNVQPSHRAQEHHLIAYNCAILGYTFTNFSAAWNVENCYAKHKGLCKHKLYDYVWIISKNHDDYFEFDRHSESKCPDDYYFSLPRTPLEQFAVVQYLKNISSDSASFWIDMNSIAVNDCWVTGGPQAVCPYRRAVSKRNFVSMITPLAACSFAILCVVFYLSLLRLPIHNNRKRWKRIIGEVSKWEVDGVPA